MIEELVSRVFTTRNAVHLAHWKAKGEGSYARHQALGDLYDGLTDKIDGIVEMYQGAFGLIGDPRPKTTEFVAADKLISHLEDEADWIQENTEEIADGSRAIENAIDELAGLYLSSLYKLKILR